MAADNKPPIQSFFDIETSGVTKPTHGTHFARSSILEIAFSTPKGIRNLEARPALNKMSLWSFQKVWQPARKFNPKLVQAMETEKQILRGFLTHLTDLPTGSELIGWNVGYNIAKAAPTDALAYGYDIPGMMTRASKYGMDKEMGEQIARHTVRDIGAEFSVRAVEGLYGTGGGWQRAARHSKTPMVTSSLGSQGVDRLVRLGILDKRAVQANRLKFIDQYLDLLLTQGIDLAEIGENARKMNSPYLKQGSSSSIQEALTSLRNIPEFTIDSSMKGSVDPKVRRQALGFYKQSILTGKDTVQGRARRVSLGNRKFAGWAQETVQKTFMDFYGVRTADGAANLDNALVKTFAKQQGVTLREAWKTLSSSQTHRAKQDIAIAQALTTHVDQMDEITQDPTKAKKFYSIWGKQTEYKKMISSVVYHSFSGKRLDELKSPIDGAKPFGGFSEATFFEDLASQAKDTYGDVKDWNAELRALKSHETLATKFNLPTEKTLGQLGIPQSPELRQLIAQEALAEITPSRLKGLGIAGGAIAATNLIGPMGIVDDPGSKFVGSMDPYWQHTLLGIPKITGNDEEYNTIPGMRHGRMAGDLRGRFTDFGSGWMPGKDVSLEMANSEFSLDPNMETRRRLQEVRKSGGDRDSLLRFQRSQKYSQDTSLSAYLSRLSEVVPANSRAILSGMIPGPDIPLTMYGVNLDPRILDFRQNTLQDPDAYADYQEKYKAAQREGREQLGKFERGEMFETDLGAFKGISLEASNLRAVNLHDFHMEVEDADTLVLKRKGLMNTLDKPVYIRLAGIDAPEIGGHGHDPMAEWRINQEQPHGRAAAGVLQSMIDRQEEMSLIIDPNQVTYGRYVGTLAGDEGSNLNLELLREGAVSALPWGSSDTDVIDRDIAAEYEEQAYEEDAGMWKYTRYQATREMSKALGTSITHNTFTDITKLAKNPDLAGYAGYLEGLGPTQHRKLTSSERSGIRGVSENLKRSGYSGNRRPRWQSKYGGGRPNTESMTTPRSINKYKLYQSSIPLTSRDDAHNSIEGLRHGGSAAAGRRQTDFGSGWKSARNQLKQFYFPKVQETSTKFAKPQSPTLDTPVSSTVERVVRQDAATHRSATTRAVLGDTAASRVAQVKNTPRRKKHLETKDFMSYNFDSGKSRKLDIPNFSSKTTVKSNTHSDNELRATRYRLSAESAKRKLKLISAHKQAVVLASRYNQHAGKRSRMGAGADSFVMGI